MNMPATELPALAVSLAHDATVRWTSFGLRLMQHTARKTGAFRSAETCVSRVKPSGSKVGRLSLPTITTASAPISGTKLSQRRTISSRAVSWSRIALFGHITRACSSVSSAPVVWISTSVNASWRQVIGWKMAVFLLSWARAAVTPLATTLRPLAPSGLAMNIVVRDTVCTPLFLCFDLLFVPSILFQAFSRLWLCRISQLLCRYAGHIY